MKKYLLLLAPAVLLLVGCAKEKFAEPNDEGLTKATFSVSVDDGVATKAVSDNDGAGAKVNRCIMEIYFQDQLYTRLERPVTDKVATFANVPVVAGKQYQVLFWADCGKTGKTENTENTDKYYSTGSKCNGNKGLKAVTIIHNEFITALESKKNDELDAFFSADNYTVPQTGGNFNAKLKRPFAQLNVITTDVATGKTVTSADLLPEKVFVSYDAATTFNVADSTITGTATYSYKAPVYGSTTDWSDVKTRGEFTLSMDYILASTDKGAVDITFKTKNGENVVMTHSLTNLPYQRNYRTNVKGDLLTVGGTWTATVTPAWTGTITHPVVIATTLKDAQAAFGPDAGGEAASTVIVKPEAVTNRDQSNDKTKTQIVETTPSITDNLPAGAKAIEFVLTPQSQKDVTFELPKLPEDQGETTFYWYIRHEEGYPTENLNVKVSEGDATRVIIDAPNNTHVVLNDVEYTHVIAITGPTTLVVPQGIKVDKLTIKKGGVEIHGTVETLEITGSEEDVFFRSCEGLSAAVFAKIYKESEGIDFIDRMYTYVQVGEKYNIYKLPVVAKIGDKEYPSIASALADASANDVIDVVAESVEIPDLKKEGITVKGNGTTKVTSFGTLSGKDITLDGFEFTVQIYGAKGENFIIKNSKFTGNNGLRYAYANGNVLIENCVFDTDVYGIHFDGNKGNNVTVKKCEITGFNTFNPSLTFDNCKFVDSKKGNKYYAVQGYSNVAFNDCSFSEKWCDTNPEVQTIGLAKNQGFVEISNCTFAVGTVLDACKNSGLGVIAIDATGNATDGYTAGTFMAKQASDIKAAPSYVVTAVEGKEDVWTVGGPYEARIGQVYYTTLQAAVDAVQAGETITLLCDVKTGFYGIEQILQKDFTVDPQGHLYYSSGYSIDWDHSGYYITDQNTKLLYFNGGTALYGTTAFKGETLIVPEGITDIAGNKRFAESTTLKYVKLSSTVTKLWNRFFNKAYALEKIYYKVGDEYVEGLAPYLTTIEDAVFMTCGLTSPIVIPSSMTEVPANLFQESHICSVVLPEGITAIGANAFRQIAELTEVTIPSTLQTIGNQAFRDCTNLKTINLLFETVPATIGSFTFNAVSTMFGATTPGIIYVKTQEVADALKNAFDSNALQYYSIKNYDEPSIVYYKGSKTN